MLGHAAIFPRWRRHCSDFVVFPLFRTSYSLSVLQGDLCWLVGPFAYMPIHAPYFARPPVLVQDGAAIFVLDSPIDHLLYFIRHCVLCKGPVLTCGTIRMHANRCTLLCSTTCTSPRWRRHLGSRLPPIDHLLYFMYTVYYVRWSLLTCGTIPKSLQ